jgi:NAD(P)-dependent dehydrogenase (short-subunit alcohol dehydrogenase family)
VAVVTGANSGIGKAIVISTAVEKFGRLDIMVFT